MAARKKAPSEEEQIRRAVETARRLLNEKGFAPVGKLGPAQVRPAVTAQLLREGFEPAAKGVRVPLFDQGLRLIELGHPIPLAALSKRLGGCSSAEAKELAKRLHAAGQASLVLRGKQHVLVPPTEPVQSQEHLRAGARELKALLDFVKRAAADKLGPSVLATDLSEAWREAQAAFGTPSQGRTQASGPPETAATLVETTPPPKELHTALRGAILSLRDEDTALARVPELSRHVRSKASANQVKMALLAAFQRGELELRPEGGIGRLTAEDAELCPVGPGRVPLSWVRLRDRSGEG